MPLYITYPTWIRPEIIPGLFPRWYGLMYIIAFAITYLLFSWQVKKKALPVGKDTVSNFFFAGLAGLIVGARLFATLLYADNRDYYWSHLWMIFWPFDPSTGQFTGFVGMSYHGALLGIVVGMGLYTYVKKINFLEWGDMLAVAFPLGYTFGRIGNFINGELWGRVTTVPWGILFPNAEPISVKEPWVKGVMEKTGITQIIHTKMGDFVNLPRHPSQLYEALGEGILLWLILWFLVRPRIPFRGFAVGVYLIGYGVVRFILEYFRTPDPGMDFPIMFDPVRDTSQIHIYLLNFTTGQILNAIEIVAGVICLFAFSALDKRQKAAQLAQSAPKNPQKRRHN
jgi:phosphatidylglycerol:prolipoprotein diacylglycerol transferase